MISKNILFLFSGFSFLGGIFIHNINIQLNNSLLVLLLIGVLFLNYFFYTKKYLSIGINIILGFLLGIIISHISLLDIEKKEEILIPYISNEKYNLTLKVEDVYKIEDYNRQYLVSLKNIQSKKINNNIKAIIKVPKNFNIPKGSTLEAKIKILPFKSTSDFQYKEYMISKNIFFQAYVNEYKIITTGEENFNDRIRKSILNIIQEIYPGEEALFLGGILIGAREQLPEELKINFNKSGLTHFIAVSGFNITILIIFFSLLGKYLPRFIEVIMISGVIIFFTFLVGFTAPVIRASIMGLLGYYILTSGRKGDILSIILLTAIIMVLFSPYSLNYDISFHLSFLAVLGIIYTQDIFKKIFYFLPEVFAIKEAFMLTLGALSFTLPIMIFNFGQLSLLSPLANIAVAWTIPIAMGLGFLSILVYYVFPFLGIIIGFFTWLLLKFDILMVYLFGSANFAILQFNFGEYKNIGILSYLGIMVFLVLYFGDKQKEIQD